MRALLERLWACIPWPTRHKGWAIVVNPFDDVEYHVIPIGDLWVHALEDCACGPRTDVVRPDDDDEDLAGYVVVHFSLDGREASE